MVTSQRRVQSIRQCISNASLTMHEANRNLYKPGPGSTSEIRKQLNNDPPPFSFPFSYIAKTTCAPPLLLPVRNSTTSMGHDMGYLSFSPKEDILPIFFLYLFFFCF